MKLGIDIGEYCGVPYYLIINDYYSKWLDIKKLRIQQIIRVITVKILKGVFSIPRIIYVFLTISHSIINSF